MSRGYPCPWCNVTGLTARALLSHTCPEMLETYAGFGWTAPVIATGGHGSQLHPSLARVERIPTLPGPGSAGPVPFVLRPLPSADEPHVGAPGRRSIEGDAS